MCQVGLSPVNYGWLAVVVCACAAASASVHHYWSELSQVVCEAEAGHFWF